MAKAEKVHVPRVLTRANELTQVVMERITGLLRQGNRLETALLATGVRMDTYRDWAKRGRAGEEPYAALDLAVGEALALAEVDALASVQKASQGYVKREVKRGQVVGRDGDIIDVEQVKTTREFDWKAGAFLLERSNPGGWGRKDVREHTGPGGSPMPSVHVHVGGGAELDALQALKNRFGKAADPAPLAAHTALLDDALEGEVVDARGAPAPAEAWAEAGGAPTEDGAIPLSAFIDVNELEGYAVPWGA